MIETKKLIKIGHFILIILVVIIAGLHLVNLMLNMADSYQAISDPCLACEKSTNKICKPGVRDTFCMDDDCTKVNLSSIQTFK